MNVGKSTTKEVLNYCQGASTREHLLFLTGGNLNSTGTSEYEVTLLFIDIHFCSLFPFCSFCSLFLKIAIKNIDERKPDNLTGSNNYSKHAFERPGASYISEVF